MKKVLLFLFDFTAQGEDKLFLWSHGCDIGEISAEDLVDEDCEIVCHDYWMIAPAIYKKTGRLPRCAIDVEELRISTSGKRKDRENRDRTDFSKSLVQFLDEESIGRYKNSLYRRKSIDFQLLARVAEAILKLYEYLEGLARAAEEWERFVEVELPVANYLGRSISEGIAISEPALRNHKSMIDFSYYMALKEFSAKYSLPLEVPSDDEVYEYLEPKFDFSGVGLEYVLNFVPMSDGFAESLLNLRKVANFRNVLNAIPLSQKRIFPLVDVFGSITSRVYFKDPSLQNLSKHHRDIISADEGMILSYVDYDQFEVGIMAALSSDSEILNLFSAGDLYESAAKIIFSDINKRKYAKRLFLSYAYGMKKKGLIDAAVGFGGDRQAAKSFFNKFEVFEVWKKEIWKIFQESGKIGTSFGNFLVRDEDGALTEKERRSAVSQVVQGTASLIFKKALIQLSAVSGVKLKLPMHDAVLFQHAPDFDPLIVANLFSNVMSEHFENKLVGKAALSSFVLDDISLQ